MPTLTIRGQNTPVDYYHAYRTYWSTSPALKFSRIGAALLFMSGAIFVYSNRSDWPGYVMVGIALLIWFNAIGRLQIALSIGRNKRLTLPYEAIFNDAGVVMNSSQGRGRMAWNRTRKYIESDDAFLLFSAERSFLVFPKRYFTEKEIESLRKLLKKRVG